MVDGGRVMKRMRPAPQGRGYRIRKRSNHVTLIVDSKPNNTPTPKGAKAKAVEVKTEAPAVEPTTEKKTRTKRTKKEAETK